MLPFVIECITRLDPEIAKELNEDMDDDETNQESKFMARLKYSRRKRDYADLNLMKKSYTTMNFLTRSDVYNEFILSSGHQVIGMLTIGLLTYFSGSGAFCYCLVDLQYLTVFVCPSPSADLACYGLISQGAVQDLQTRIQRQFLPLSKGVRDYSEKVQIPDYGDPV